MKKLILLEQCTKKIATRELPKEVILINKHNTIYAGIKQVESGKYIDEDKIHTMCKELTTDIAREYPYAICVFAKEVKEGVWDIYIEYETKKVITSYVEALNTAFDVLY